MAVPKKKTSRSKTNQRRSHLALGKNHYIENKKTGALQRMHHIDLDGYYGDKKIIHNNSESEG